MKSLKTSSLFRLTALLLISVITVCMVGFVTQGWQSESPNPPESGETDENNGETDENTDGAGETVIPEPPPPPEYTHYLTGLVVSAEESRQKPLCFVMDAASPLYGTYGSPLTIEIPIEGGQSRLLVYRNHSQNLGKIGSIAEGRDCITRLLDFFGGIAIYNGESIPKSPSPTTTSRFTFDLSKYSGYAYTENTSYLYSNGDLLLAGLQNAGISISASEATSLPFSFAAHDATPIRYQLSAQTVTIPYSDANETGLYYDVATHEYLLAKGGQTKNDLLNGKATSFKNAFVLFSDATTFESAERTEMIMDTDGGGTGYYFTEGSATAITWHLDALGKLAFFNEKGEILTVNRGTSYISYYKSALCSNVVFS